MRDENEAVQFRDLDEVLHTAQLRRTAEIGTWLKQYFEARRRGRSQQQAAPVNTGGQALA